MFVKQVHFYYKQKKYHLAFLSLKVFRIERRIQISPFSLYRKTKKYFQKITIYPQTKHSNKRNAKSFNFMQFEPCPHAFTNCIFYSTSGLSG